MKLQSRLRDFVLYFNWPTMIVSTLLAWWQLSINYIIAVALRPLRCGFMFATCFPSPNPTLPKQTSTVVVEVVQTDAEINFDRRMNDYATVSQYVNVIIFPALRKVLPREKGEGGAPAGSPQWLRINRGACSHGWRSVGTANCSAHNCCARGEERAWRTRHL